MNLMRNSCFKQGPSGGPQFYTFTEPITYDDFCYNGCRTCSLTMKDCDTATMEYDLFMNVSGCRCLTCSLYLRTIELTNLCYVVEFYDECKQFLCKESKNVTSKAKPYFNNLCADFSIPRGARCAKFYWRFKDKTTACTWCNPRAFVC